MRQYRAVAGGAQASKPDRRAAILRAWHGARDWIDTETVAAIASTRFDAGRSCLWIDLKDGSTLVDQGDSIALRGRLTWTAALETAAAAERHGWTEIRVHGDQAYKDAVSVAAMLRGITVLNHELSPRARAELDRLMAERTAISERRGKLNLSRNSDDRHEIRFQRLSSREVHQRITKRRSQADRYAPPDSPEEEIVAPVLKPGFPKLVAKRTGTKKRDRRHRDRKQH